MARIEPVVYFEDTGKAAQNTRRVAEVVGEYLKAHRVRHVVMATNTGYVGAKFAPLAEAHPKVNFVGVKMAPAVDKMYDVKWNARYGKTMEKAGVKLVCGTHALTGGVDRAIRAKFEGYPPSAVMAETLYLFSQGMKVCVEIIAMACDAGMVPEAVQVVSCAGTGHGSDTAIAATSAASANLFDMDIHRVLAMPLKK
ncbi:MAG: hypothetical protein JSV79_13055 [Armatimonadota bacterium]|nr:MAG: hypothetical protein JSV79_13055 [Armatimonadota bacterium]